MNVPFKFVNAGFSEASKVQADFDALSTYVNSLWVNVKDFGAVGNGVTNDQAAFQAAHDSIVASGLSGTLFIPAGTYKINSGLTINVSYVSIMGSSSKLDFSSQTSGAAITFTGGDNSYVGNPYFNADKYIANLTIVGNGSGGSVKGFKFYRSSEPGPAHFKIYNCSITQFGTGISIEENSYLLAFFGTNVWICGTCVSMPSATNTGERIYFSGCAFFNSGTGFNIANTLVDAYMDGCSIDGIDTSYIQMSAGQFNISNSHIEGTLTTARAFYVPASSTDVYITFNGCFFVIKGSRANPVFDMQDTTYFNLNESNVTCDTNSGVVIVNNASSSGAIAIQGTRFNAADTAVSTSSYYWKNDNNSGIMSTNKQISFLGTITNDSASTGYVGEYVFSTIALASAVTLTTATYADVTSISLTAGDWDVSGNVTFTGNVTGTQVLCGVGTASGTSGTGITVGDTAVDSPTVPTGVADYTSDIPMMRKSLSGTTTLYLKAYGAFTVGTLKAYGKITARRVR